MSAPRLPGEIVQCGLRHAGFVNWRTEQPGDSWYAAQVRRAPSPANRARGLGSDPPPTRGGPLELLLRS